MANAIRDLMDKSKRLPTTPDAETATPLAVWKYAALSEVLPLYTAQWMPRYQAAVATLQQHNADLLNVVETIDYREDGEARPLSSTQRETLAIYAQQALLAFTGSDPVAQMKGGHLAKVQGQLLGQLQQYAAELGAQSRFHPEDYATIRQQITDLQTTVQQWHGQARTRVAHLSNEGTELSSQLETVQRQIRDGYTLLQESEPWAGVAPIWKALSGFQVQMAHYHQALAVYDVPALEATLSALRHYTTTIVEGVPSLEDPPLSIHAPVLLAQVEWQHLNAQTNHHSTQTRQLLRQHDNLTARLQRAGQEAVAALVVGKKSQTTVGPVLGQLAAVLEQIQTLPETILDWAPAQLVLHSQLHHLVLALRALPTLSKTDQQQINAQWILIDEALQTWNQGSNRASDELVALRQNADTALDAVTSALSELYGGSLSAQTNHVVSKVWQATHALRQALERYQDGPTHELDRQLETLSQLNQLMEAYRSALQGLERPSKRLHFALAENLGKAKAAQAQASAVRASVIPAFEQYQRQLEQQEQYLLDIKAGIGSDPKASMAPWEALQPTLTYILNRLQTIEREPVEEVGLNIVLYDQWQMEQLLETAAAALHGLSNLPPEAGTAFGNWMTATLASVKNRKTALGNWTSRLQEQANGLADQLQTMTTQIEALVEGYFAGTEMEAFYTMQQQVTQAAHLTAVLDHPLLTPFNPKPLVEALESALATWPLEQAPATDPTHKATQQSILDQAQNSLIKAVANQQMTHRGLKQHYHSG